MKTASLLITGEIGWDITADRVALQLAEKAIGASTIEVHLNSLGGSVFDGLAIYNMLKNHPARVEVSIMGVAASVASFIAMAGDAVYIPENAWMMLHKPIMGNSGGNADTLRDRAKTLDQFEDSLITAYADKSGKKYEEIQDLLRSETWLQGQDAIEAGFADFLTEAVEVAASLKNLYSTEDIRKMFPKNLGDPEKDTPETPESEPETTPESTPDTPPEATPEAAPEPADTPAEEITDIAARVAKSASRDTMHAQFQRDEANRRQSIKSLFNQFPEQRSVMDACLDNMEVTAAMAKDHLLNALGAQVEPIQQGDRLRAKVYAGNGDIVRQSMANAIAARSGLEPIESGNKFKGMALIECARQSLVEAGVSAYGMDRMQMVAAAFTHTTGDFGMALADTANKAMLKGYEAANETFSQFTTAGTLPDFKAGSRVGLGLFPTLDKVPEGVEYRYGTLVANGEPIQLATYGKMFSITRQCVINDDLGMFTSVPSKMGRAAARTVGDLVFAILTGNPNMADGVALFDAKHKNVQSEANLDVASLEKAATLMAIQEDVNGGVLNIEPGYLVVPRALKAQADVLMNSMYDPAGLVPGAPNPVQGMATVVADARLDKAVVNNKVPFYLLASTAFDTIEVAYLDGNSSPFMDQQQGWNVDGTVFKVRLDAGVSPLSYHTMVRNLPK